jgi:hypothetical protein
MVSPYLDVTKKVEGGGFKNWVAQDISTEAISCVVEVPIKSITRISKPQQRYDIGVEDNHNYYVGKGILVSNSFGAMNYLTSNADELGVKLYRWSIFEVMKPCQTCRALDAHPHGSDEQRNAVCPLWDYCHGQRAMKATGWVDLDEVLTDIRVLGGIATNEVQTQLLCLRPSTTGLVYYNFANLPKSLGGNIVPFQYVDSPTFKWYAVHDPAESRKSVIYCVYYDEDNAQSYFFAEHIMPECGSTMEHIKEFNAWIKSNGWKKPFKVIVDPRRVDSVADWRAGAPMDDGTFETFDALCPSVKDADGGNTITRGISELRKLVFDGYERRIFVNKETCPSLVNMFREYHYPMDKSGKVTSEIPAEAFKDEADTARYWARYVLTVLSPRLFKHISVLSY